LARIHTPDKLGFPSAMRGVGAVICTRPCASRGTAGDVGSCIFGHCAATEPVNAASPITIKSTFFIRASW
jgi:hypothetical protein